MTTKHKQHPFWTFFNIAKKFVDPLDDLWALLRGLLPSKLFNLIGPLISGCVGFFIHFIEACQGMKKAYHAYQDPKRGQRKTRMMAGLLSTSLGCIGTGFSLLLILGIGNLPLLSVLVSALLVGIYSTSLIKHSYIYHQHRNSENDIRRWKAGRHVAFGLLEVIGTTAITLGILLGSEPLIGISLSTAPLALLLAGVTIGALTKFIDWYDKKEGYLYTKPFGMSTHAHLAKHIPLNNNNLTPRATSVLSPILMKSHLGDQTGEATCQQKQDPITSLGHCDYSSEQNSQGALAVTQTVRYGTTN